jgi:tetratricopeptide (TPR) repeat protein
VDQVAEYREMGISLFDEGKYDDAIVEMQKVLSASPKDTDALDYLSRSYVELGKAHLAEKRINEAKAAFTTALDTDENCRECQDMLALCRTTEAEILRSDGEQELRDSQFDSAITTLERAVALNPKDELATDFLFQAHYQKALILYEKKDYLAAKNSFASAATVKPDCSDCNQYVETSMDAYKELHYNQGIVFFGQEELKKAIDEWEKVVAVDPDYKDVRQNLKKANLLNERLERIKKSATE